MDIDPRYVVVDLSKHFSALRNYVDIAEALTEDEHVKIVDWVKTAHTMSYRQLSNRFPHWDEADKAHDVYTPPESTSFVDKMVIPDTRAITDTVITYIMAAVTGRNPMFQLEGTDRKSRRASRVLERALHQNIRRTAAEAKLAQFVLDSTRYGYAPTRVFWDDKLKQNIIRNYDPRRAFTDPRVQWGDWDKMQFMIFSDIRSFNELYTSGRYPYLYTHPEERNDRGHSSGWEGHRHHRQKGPGLVMDQSTPHDRSGNYFTLGNNRWVDTCMVRFTGYEVGMPGLSAVYLMITTLDERRVISMKLNPYGMQFNSVIGGIYHDVHKTYSQSLYDMLLPLHEIATWLMRSRYDNVRAALQNLIFADPQQVMITDLIDRNEWGVVRMLPGGRVGEGVHVAEVPDVTRGHWTDIAGLADMKQRVSAASDTLQGTPTQGVRSATEVNQLQQMGTQRLGLISRIMSATAFRPMVNMMVENIQDSMSGGSILVGDDRIDQSLQPMVNEGYIDYEPGDLQGDVSYLIIDGTLPPEPSKEPQMWLDMLQILTQTGMFREYRMPKLVDQAFQAMGVPDLELFKIPREEQGEQTPSQEINMLEKMRGASVQPNEKVQREVERGNLVPVSEVA